MATKKNTAKPKAVKSLRPKKVKAVSKKPKAKKVKKASKPKGSLAQYDAQEKIRKVSKIATDIQQKGGQKVVTTKVYRVNRADAVKQAWKKIK